MKKQYIWMLCFISLSVSFWSCKSAPEYRLRSEKSETSRQWVIDISAAENGNYLFEMYGPLLESSVIQGEAFREPEGSWIIHLDTLEWFHNHPMGWTEGSFALWGTLRLIPEGTEWKVEVVEKPWLDSVSSGSIRYKDSIIGGSRGRDLLHRRWLRISTLSELFHEKLEQDHYEQLMIRKKDNSVHSFERDLGRFLLPEIYGYPDGIAAAVNPEALFYAQHHEWDGLYTASILPEEWRELRNTGTLYRDFQEGLPLMWVYYNWDWIWSDALQKELISE